jgi:Zn-finger nucleic acid-binding protein
MSFSPVIASKHIVEKYKRYLNTVFEISDKTYSEQFKHELCDKQSFAKGPFLDVTDSFVKGKDIAELIKNGTLSKGFEKINMPINRPLYKHQEIAIERGCKGKNFVVSTGTGSGKTESFLIPVLNHIVREHEAGKLTAGIRALIIYPMNALANDQVERLRSILLGYPEITFGSYTGQTREKFEDALIEYKSLNYGNAPLKNELICRKQMKENPPHIFITNYAMLEYLMLRPDDSVFFSSQYADKWKYIILDEAHVYNGSTGIEVSMLLRRLKAKLSNPDIRYILTSATLGSENENNEVAQFAQNLCDSKFDENDIIRAYRVLPVTHHEKYSLNNEFYDEIAGMFDHGEQDTDIARVIKNKLRIAEKNNSLEELLYEVVVHDELYWRIRDFLQTPKTVVLISNYMKWSQEQVANFVAVAAKCDKNGDKLFDARYHMFLRATESVFITLYPSNRLFLTRKECHVENDGNSYKIFEIATCNSCHTIYLVGKVVDNFLVQSAGFFETAQKTVFLLGDSISDTDEEHTLEDEQIAADTYEICSRCGFLHKTGSPEANRCDHGKNYYIKVIKVVVKNEGGKLTKCLSCENTNNFGILRMFFTGQEAVTSVVGTALFEELPSYRIIRKTIIEEDDSGFGSGAKGGFVEKTKEAKQFIAFSDSRQAAAFYASYFDQTYRNILYKRLVTETLKMQKSNLSTPTATSFIEDLIFQFEKYGIADKDSDLTRKEAWKALLHEIVDNNGNTSLYSMGLMGVSISNKNLGENIKYNLSNEEVSTMCSVFAMGMMADAAIFYDAPLNKADKDYFTHNGVEFSYTLSDSSPKSYKRAFIPTKANMKNKRLDYLIRILGKKGFCIDNEQAAKLLTGVWNNIFCSNQIVKAIDGKYRLDAEKIIITRPQLWYICSKCKKVTIHNIEGICPSYKCEGHLQSIDLSVEFLENHYYQMYQSLDIRELRIVEHTAQLDKETAYDYQKKFQRKEIDILSCSTTFEMGVDVGTLETVFMRNMPPSPANYAQRAGRAGRSKHSAAYALTFCNKSNHDFSFFSTPEKMIRGKINPPKFNVENDKIAIRHLYASALSFFWKRNSAYFGSVKNFAHI